jgi:hypothetical protein
MLPYIQNLTPHERAEAIKLGMELSMARNGISPAALEKKAAWGHLDLIPKSILVTSLLAGIPLGAIAHVLGRATATDNRKEREALDRLRFFQRTTANMESGLNTAVKEDEAAPTI